MYIAGGVSAVVASGALTKQFGKDVVQGAKPGNSTAKPVENAPNSSETYFRIEGGGNGTQTRQNRINVNSDGSVTINSGCSGQLCVSTNGPNHAAYYLTNRRQDVSSVFVNKKTYAIIISIIVNNKNRNDTFKNETSFLKLKFL